MKLIEKTIVLKESEFGRYNYNLNDFNKIVIADILNNMKKKNSGIYNYQTSNINIVSNTGDLRAGTLTREPIDVDLEKMRQERNEIFTNKRPEDIDFSDKNYTSKIQNKKKIEKTEMVYEYDKFSNFANINDNNNLYVDQNCVNDLDTNARYNELKKNREAEPTSETINLQEMQELLVLAVSKISMLTTMYNELQIKVNRLCQ